jgi:hypothetical protein
MVVAMFPPSLFILADGGFRHRLVVCVGRLVETVLGCSFAALAEAIESGWEFRNVKLVS